VSIRYQADNDLKRIIVDATLRRERSIDFQTAQVAGLDDLDDELVLRRASEQGRILVSHDKRTMPRAWRRSSR
jgi:predicted nuclease of predicted toxin-antitoxin system